MEEDILSTQKLCEEINGGHMDVRVGHKLGQISPNETNWGLFSFSKNVL